MAHNVTVAVDHGELPSGNGRKVSREQAKLVVEEVLGRRPKTYGTSLVSVPSFEHGNTAWVVDVAVELRDGEIEALLDHAGIETVEETAIQEVIDQ